eukprot:4233392-Prymnesium_polylepis.1
MHAWRAPTIDASHTCRSRVCAQTSTSPRTLRQLLLRSPPTPAPHKSQSYARTPPHDKRPCASSCDAIRFLWRLRHDGEHGARAHKRASTLQHRNIGDRAGGHQRPAAARSGVLVDCADAIDESVRYVDVGHRTRGHLGPAAARDRVLIQ